MQLWSLLTYRTQQSKSAAELIRLTLMKWQLVIKQYYSNVLSLGKGAGGDVDLAPPLRQNIKVFLLTTYNILLGSNSVNDCFLHLVTVAMLFQCRNDVFSGCYVGQSLLKLCTRSMPLCL